jgi:hypothetical protein
LSFAVLEKGYDWVTTVVSGVVRELCKGVVVLSFSFGERVDHELDSLEFRCIGGKCCLIWCGLSEIKINILIYFLRTHFFFLKKKIVHLLLFFIHPASLLISLIFSFLVKSIFQKEAIAPLVPGVYHNYKSLHMV